jgi:hypothetical protein
MSRKTQLIRMIVKGPQAPIITVPLSNDLLFYERKVPRIFRHIVFMGNL